MPAREYNYMTVKQLADKYHLKPRKVREICNSKYMRNRKKAVINANPGGIKESLRINEPDFIEYCSADFRGFG